jgi:hypothetical protein
VRALRTLVAVLALTAGAAACGSEQDPGVTPGSTTGGPTTTSHLLSACPAGGPDATTPAAGCLDADGKVVH